MPKIIGNTTVTPYPRPDWNQTNPDKVDYIKNKPTILTEEDVVELIEENGGNTTIDQVQSDWNQTDETQVDYIKNKPTILTEDDVVGLIEQNSGGNFGDGATFIPSVSENGDLSWTNDKGLVNPATVNIKGKSAYQAACDGGYKGTEEEFNALLANVGSGERPTDDFEIGDNLYIVSTNGTQGALICSYGGEVPEGTEIKSIEIYTDEYGWLDIRALATVDFEYTFYVANVYKAYIEPTENMSCYGGFMAFSPSVFGTMAANYQITNARITYYTDRGVNNE